MKKLTRRSFLQGLRNGIAAAGLGALVGPVMFLKRPEINAFDAPKFVEMPDSFFPPCSMIPYSFPGMCIARGTIFEPGP